MILQALHIQKSFGSLRAVDDVNLNLQEGQIQCIVGESGSGKSTLAKILVGLLRPNSGQVITNAHLQMVFQDPYTSLDPLYTVRGILSEAFYKHKKIAVSKREEEMRQVLT